MKSTLIQRDDVRILAVADIRGEISIFNRLAKEYNADMIIHTGNFGFLDSASIDRIHESYLRHIVEFSPLLPENLILEISKLSKVTGRSVEHLSNEHENLKKLLRNHSISELEDFIQGKKKLDIPVYTIYGMCEDSLVINKFRYGVYKVPNLYIVDDSSIFTVEMKNQVLLFAGIGGSLSYHKLFHQGSTIDLKDIIGDGDEFSDLRGHESLIPVSGDPGNIWVTILQLGKLIYTLIDYSQQNPEIYNKAIKIFITHQSPTREPLLEHLAIFFKMDYTISNSLHFKYTSSYNELSINPTFEAFKAKFNDCRTKFATIWKNVQPKFEKLLYGLNDPMMITCVELALEVFDKIPISTKSSDVIIPLQLSKTGDSDTSSMNLQSKQRELNAIIRQLNDLYYISFQNTWHYNLCDLGYGSLLLYFDDGHLSMQCKAKGFDFTYRGQSEQQVHETKVSDDFDIVARPVDLTEGASDNDDGGGPYIIRKQRSASSLIFHIIFFLPNNVLFKPIGYILFIVTYPIKLVMYLLFYRVSLRDQQSPVAVESASTTSSSSPSIKSLTSSSTSSSSSPTPDDVIEFEVDKGDDGIKSPTEAAPITRHLPSGSSSTTPRGGHGTPSSSLSSKRPKKKLVFPRLLFNFDISNPPNMPKKTLVLDLDETLIHSLSRYNSSILTKNKGVTVEVRLNNSGLATLYHIYKRPHVEEFLGIVRHWFNLVCFTASIKEYADPVINYLEGEVILKDKADNKATIASSVVSDTVFSQRFYRDSCIFIEGRGYVKDLSFLTGRDHIKSPSFGPSLSQTPSPSPSSSPKVVPSIPSTLSPPSLILSPMDSGRSRSRSRSRCRTGSRARNSKTTDLSKIIIVDNSPISYSYHRDNGIMIEGWINDPDDFELMTLLPLLNGLRFTSDVRAILGLKNGQSAFK
ncbi:hypothetical protein FOA43_002178 [Brettanomyces nanus]|uniref:FCP1 homology domain-containing protein n=1 Tax=Eeniella nana TaxID=13502 RepID=A0A875S450_EENNA|nr:uncharacterized protein FOA43_002178 [Brettanomyces nanus]QPG74842.1 hypothetical protein FOA43_002178 [Brettanomyces nanus]